MGFELSREQRHKGGFEGCRWNRRLADLLSFGVFLRMSVFITAGR